MALNSFWGQLLFEVFRGLILVGVALLSYALLSKRWEQHKLSSELTLDVMRRFWARLDVLARKLSASLSADLQKRSETEKQDTFYNLLDFRLTLAKFYQDMSGWIPGTDQTLEERTTKLQDAVVEQTATIISRYDISKALAGVANSPGVPTIPYYRVIDVLGGQDQDGYLKTSYERYVVWVTDEDAVKRTGSLFADYAENLRALIKSVFPMY